MSITALEAGSKLKLLGERVALSEVEEVNDSGLELPANRTKQHVICQVVSVGDGKVGEETKPMWPTTGDVILIQMNPMLAKQMSQRVGEIPLFVVHQNDCIARILNRAVTYENFSPLGRWVFIRVDFEQQAGNIWLPQGELFSHSGDTKFFFESCGAGANLDFKQGQQIYCDKTRVNVLSLNGKKYAYIDRDSVIGWADSPGD